MSEKDIKESIKNIEDMFTYFPNIFHYKVHTIFNVEHVPVTWKIEKDRRNKDLHLLLVKGGRGYYFLNGKKEELKQGKIIFVSNDYPHSAIPNTKDLPSIIPIRFGIYSNKTNLQIEHFFTKPFSFSLIPNDILKYERLFERLCILKNNDNNFNPQMINSLLCQIFYELIIDLKYNKNTKYDKRIQEAKLYIDKNPCKINSVKDIANIANLSTKQVTRLFNIQYKISPYQYILQSKIRYATFLLEETEMNIKEIAFYLGYPDQFSFSKQFKKYTGYPPSKWQKI